MKFNIKRNLILMTSVVLILVMAFSVVSAGWFTGKATASDSNPWAGPYKIYEGKIVKVQVGGEKYDIKLIAVNSDNTASILVDGVIILLGSSAISSNGIEINPMDIRFYKVSSKNNYVKFIVRKGIVAPTEPEETTTKTSIESSGNMVRIRTTIKDGELVLPVWYVESTWNTLALGKSYSELLFTSEDKTVQYNESLSSLGQRYIGFIASWANEKYSESYYLRASVSQDGTTGVNKTTITNKVTGMTICEKIVAGQTCYIDNVVLTINSVSYTAGGDRSVTMSINSGGSFNKLYSTDGTILQLPTPVNMGLYDTQIKILN